MKTVGLRRALVGGLAWRGLVVLCAFGTLAPSLLTVQRALATSPTSATDEIGQTDNNGNLLWTKDDNNNRRMPDSGGFGWMSGMVMDRTHHKFYVAEETQNDVLVYNLDSSNQFADRVPDYLLGQDGWGYGSSAGTTQNALSAPNGLALDVTGQRLFVADRGNNRVLIYDVSSLSMNMNAANVLGQANFTSGAAATSQTRMNAPQAVAYDPTRNLLFVGDDGVGRVLVYDVASITNGEAAVNVIGKANFTSTVACAVTSTNLCSAYALAYDDSGQRLFVSDYSNRRVLMYNVATITNGMAASNVLGRADFVTAGSAGATASTMIFPDQLEYDATNSRLIVSDFIRVLFFDVSSITNGEAATHELGEPNFTTTSGPIVDQSHVYYSMGTVFNPTDGKLYVADREEYRMMVFDINSITDGENAVDLLGQTQGDGSIDWTHYAQRNFNTNTSGLSFPYASTIDTTHHRLFVADMFNNRVAVYNLDSSNNLADRQIDAALGQTDMTGNGFSESQSMMDWPYSLAYDSGHNWLYVLDWWNHRVLVFDVASITNGENAVHVIGQTGYDNDIQDTTDSNLDSPNGIAYDNVHKRLFVADEGNSRVLVFDMSGTVSDGMAASYVLGQTDFVTNNGFTTDDAYLGDPYNLAYDPVHNRLFVADYGDHRVMVFNMNNLANGMSASYVLGQPDFVSYGYPPVNSSGLPYPQALEYDSATGQLWVSDNNNRVVMFDTNNLANGMAASAVLGQADFTSSSYGISQTQFGTTYSITVDPTIQRLYLVSGDANRMTIYDLPHVTTASLSGVTVGDAYSQSLAATGLQGSSSFALTGGSLPPGLSLQANGTLTGTPTQAGTYNFTVAVTDDIGSAGSLFSAGKVLSLTVADIPQAPSSPDNSSPNTTTSTTTDTTTTEPILLNNDTSYASPTGSVQTMATGDEVTFVLSGSDPTLPTTEQHTATVNNVTDTYVDLTIASEPINLRLYIGDTRQVDVDRDGTDDISVKLLAITDRHAQLAFRQLASTTVPVAAHEPTSSAPAATIAAATNPTDATPWVIGGVAAVIVVIGALVLLFRHRAGT